jgi:hypothetical protein
MRPVVCPVIDLPERVPSEVDLKIRAGKVIRADEGAETLLRNYIGTRKVISESHKEK